MLQQDQCQGKSKEEKFCQISGKDQKQGLCLHLIVHGKQIISMQRSSLSTYFTY